MAEPPSSELAARATDEWTRKYPLVPAGTVEVENRRGNITIEATDAAEVEVRAERVVMAATEQGARDVVPRVRIAEDVTPEKISIRSEGLVGLVIGVEAEVNFSIRVPRGAAVRARTRSGTVTVAGLSGRPVVNAVNGAIVGTDLRGGIEARATNGSIAVAMAEVATEPLDLRATNGSIALTLPATAAATIQANLTNGSFDSADLPFELIGERTPRRVRGQINGGGTLIDLTAVNGKIRVASPAAPPPPQ